jgi:hypothetical protein
MSLISIKITVKVHLIKTLEVFKHTPMTNKTSEVNKRTPMIN